MYRTAYSYHTHQAEDGNMVKENYLVQMAVNQNNHSMSLTADPKTSLTSLPTQSMYT